MHLCAGVCVCLSWSEAWDALEAGIPTVVVQGSKLKSQQEQYEASSSVPKGGTYPGLKYAKKSRFSSWKYDLRALKQYT